MWMFKVDGFYENTTFQVLDHDTYYTNLTESNLKKSIEWTKEYSAKDAFDMKNLLPVEWDYLLNKMLNDVNGTLVDKLYAFYNKKSDSATSCDTECRRSLLCGFKQARSVDYIKC
jgi:sphingomyelin phosphodiesterase